MAGLSEVETLVIECSSSSVRCGFAGDDAPRGAFDCVVGRPRHCGLVAGLGGQKDSYVGDEARAQGRRVTIKHPIERNVCTNWDDMEKIWHHTFYHELRVDPAEHPVVLTSKHDSPKAQKEKQTQIFFETFNSPAFYVANEGTCALLASGRTTGLVLDVGHGTTSVSCHHEGYRLPAADKQHNYGGSDISERLCTILRVDGNRGDLAPQFAQLVKERLCYVASDFETESETAQRSSEQEATLELPDGKCITLGDERFRAPEALFSQSRVLYYGEQPHLYDCGTELQGIQETLVRSAHTCREDIRDDLFKNVVLAGGSTMLPGFADRLRKELTAMLPSTTMVKIVSPPERKYSVWIGGSVLGSLSTFQQMWISKEEYDESGPAIVHRKCYL